MPELLDRIKLSGNTGRSLPHGVQGARLGMKHTHSHGPARGSREAIPLSVRVIGTDISLSALSLAAKGVYDQRALDSVDDDLLSSIHTCTQTAMHRRAEELCCQLQGHRSTDFVCPVLRAQPDCLPLPDTSRWV